MPQLADNEADLVNAVLQLSIGEGKSSVIVPLDLPCEVARVLSLLSS